ncbi:sensor histidine kinase [Ramlibacter sp. AN1015]|uniref:sensor histidine kinase n=1 Tax=Ramlibacter sp. AN1015 TaxID=3133428 RepID=UPI0030BA7901
MRTVTSLSLRRRLLVGILVPLVLLLVLNAAMLYARALAAANTAYDRTLLASAKVIGEQLEVQGWDDGARLHATVPYSALEAFEADNRSRMLYRVSDLQGVRVSGYAELPFWRGHLPQRAPYAALVDFYDDQVQGAAVRVAVLLQPVSSAQGRGMAVVQVAETLELRESLARQVLIDTLWRQILLLAVIAGVVVVVVQHATRPVRRLSSQLSRRREGDLSPIVAGDAPRELHPLLDATNAVMARLDHLLGNQKRFVRDTAHQLRTPLAVLRAQVQSALRGDVEPLRALAEISTTVDRATLLANQMLALAKVEQLRQRPQRAVNDFAELVRALALELSPLVAEKDLDFEIETQPCPVQAHEWMLRELARNLLHNAIRHSPRAARLRVQVERSGGGATLQVLDEGPGIAPALRARLFQPFSAGDVRSGSGLGLAICHEIVGALAGTISLDNRTEGDQIVGLLACVRLPLAENAA